MHLPRKTDGANGIRTNSCLSQYPTNRQLRRIPPVFGTLFGPEGALHAHVLMRRGEGMAHFSALIDEKGPRAASPDVNAEPEGVHTE